MSGPQQLERDETTARAAQGLSALGREVLWRTGCLRFPVAGSSMSPALEPGEVVLVEPLGDRPPRPGDILLLAAQEGQPVVHRLVARRRQGQTLLLATKGDSARSWDPVLPLTAAVGQVTGVERGGTVLALPRRPPTLWDRLRGWRTLRRHRPARPGPVS